ncbi:unnamed protein product, partial [Musa acuminata subsp. burmannicoides]
FSLHQFKIAKRTGGYSCTFSQMFGRVVCAIVTCVFAIVGSVVGAITGALIGLATESGLLRGAGIGATSGAVFSIEVVESSLDLWNSRESGIWSILYVLDIISSLLSGRTVRKRLEQQCRVQSRVRHLYISELQIPYIYTEPGLRYRRGVGGLSIDAVEKLPKVKIAAEDNVDAAGYKICCSVCLQDFQTGEMVRKLPNCQHMFHLPCIDSCWLVRHGSCPLCR